MTYLSYHTVVTPEKLISVETLKKKPFMVIPVTAFSIHLLGIYYEEGLTMKWPGIISHALRI